MQGVACAIVSFRFDGGCGAGGQEWPAGVVLCTVGVSNSCSVISLLSCIAGIDSFHHWVDVQDLARAFGYVKVGLKNMSQLLLDGSYTKSKNVTCSNWEGKPLRQKQVRWD